MPQFPRDNRIDATLPSLADPYRFISKQSRTQCSDLFETRLMLRKTICMTGPEAALLFYDQSRFMRHVAMMGRIQKTLLGKGGVQSWGRNKRGAKSYAKVERTVERHAARRILRGSRKGLKPSDICCSVSQE